MLPDSDGAFAPRRAGGPLFISKGCLAWLEESAALLRVRVWTLACCTGCDNSWLSSTTAALFRVTRVVLAELLARVEARVAFAITQAIKDCGFVESTSDDVCEFHSDNEQLSKTRIKFRVSYM